MLLSSLQAMTICAAPARATDPPEGDAAIRLAVRIEADRKRVGMGRSVTVEAAVARPDGVPAVGCLLLPYVNGKRWGAHDFADEAGRAAFHIPLPNTGIAKIQVEAWTGGPHTHNEQWVWAPRVEDNQTAFLQGEFVLSGRPDRARLWVAADDAATFHINGHDALAFGGLVNQSPVDVASMLVPGRNIISVDAQNGLGPAGLLVLLRMETPAGVSHVTTGSDWRVFRAFPDGPLTIRLTAEGTQSNYLLSYTEDSLPLSDPVHAFAEVVAVLRRAAK